MPPPDDLKSRALALLARREHSRRELARKLAIHTEDESVLEALLDELEARGWLSDRRFAEQIARVRQGRYGALRVAHELKEKGVADELIGEVLPELREGELEAARDVWRRKFGELPATPNERAKQMRFLQSRGFSLDTIRAVLRAQD